MPNGLLIIFTFAIYGLCVYGPDLARVIGRKRKIITSHLLDPAPEIHNNHSLTRYANAHYPREGNTRRPK